jgi:mono/diheme cytochrome c family protein
MQTKSIKAIVVTMITAVVILAVFISSCKKEGPAGPAGADGINGTNGTNGTAVSAADIAAYNAADGMIGGRLYDYVVNELKDENVSNMVTDTAITKHPNFFRCKSCHGWDLEGRMGHLAQMDISSKYPEVANNNLYEWAHMHNIREVFDAVKNTGGDYVQFHRNANPTTNSTGPTMPDYGNILTDAQIWQLVKFLKKEAMNVAGFYDLTIVKPYPQPTGTPKDKDESATIWSNVGKNGDVAAGKLFISSNCSCHGTDGTAINIYCQGDYLGNAFRDDPFEVQHKVKFGMPKDYDHLSTSCTGQNNSAMPAVSGMTESIIRNILAAGQDTVAYPSY